jgi:hypothetical protein
MKKILFVLSTFVLFFSSCQENDTLYITDDYYSICQINSDGTGYRKLIDKGYRSSPTSLTNIYFIENDSKILIIEENGIKEFDLNSLTSNYYNFGVIKLSALSKDRSQLALIKEGNGDQDIYIFNINSKSFTRVTNSPTVLKRGLSFSNDGLRIVYSTSFSSYSTIETVDITSGAVTQLVRTDFENLTEYTIVHPIFNFEDSEVFYFSIEYDPHRPSYLSKLRSTNNYILDSTTSYHSGLTLSGENGYLIYDDIGFNPGRIIAHNIVQNKKFILTSNSQSGGIVSTSYNGEKVMIGLSYKEMTLVNIDGTNSKTLLHNALFPWISADGNKVVFVILEKVVQ